MDMTGEPLSTRCHTYPLGGGDYITSGTLTYYTGYATEVQVQALEAENKKLRARMKRLEKLVAAALIRIDEED